MILTHPEIKKHRLLLQLYMVQEQFIPKLSAVTLSRKLSHQQQGSSLQSAVRRVSGLSSSLGQQLFIQLVGGSMAQVALQVSSSLFSWQEGLWPQQLFRSVSLQSAVRRLSGHSSYLGLQLFSQRSGKSMTSKALQVRFEQFGKGSRKK